MRAIRRFLLPPSLWSVSAATLAQTGAIPAQEHVLSLADALAVMGILISFIALGLSVAVYRWSKTDLKDVTDATAKGIKELTDATGKGIDRWSDATIRIEAATGRIEKHLEHFTGRAFDLLTDQMRTNDRAGTKAAERLAERTEELVGKIQQESRSQINRILEQQGVERDKAPEIGNQLSAVFAQNLVKSRAATDRAREDTLREEISRIVAEHDNEGVSLAAIEDLLGASYARSDIADAIGFLRSKRTIELSPDEFRPDTLVRLRRAV